MAESKPLYASEYSASTTDIIFRTSLHLACVLGAFSEDIVVVGGMVPFFLIDQAAQPYEHKHIGSRDVDLGLSIALLNSERYEAIADRLRMGGFEPRSNPDGNRIRQSWRHTVHKNAIVEFLMDADGTPSKLQNLTGDLAAIITPATRLAFRDKVVVRTVGRTLDDAQVERDVAVSGPGAFLIMKAFALEDRAFGKDAYDMFYIARHFGNGAEEIATRIRSILDDPLTSDGLNLISKNFATLNYNGPVKQALFFQRHDDDEYRADISGALMSIISFLK